MIPFDDGLVQALRQATQEDDVLEFVTLTQFGLDFGWGAGNLIQCHFRASITVDGESACWQGRPDETPIWKNIGRRILNFELVDAFSLQVDLEEGARVVVHSEDGPYESVFVLLPIVDGKHGMRVY